MASWRETVERTRIGDLILLWGLERRGLDICLTIATVALLAISRFALLASGPWEWDETLFARGMLHFELAAHFPHPPGFPGLLAFGQLLRPLAGTPYEALQWVSALASILILWPLAILGRRVAPAPVAAAAALLVLFLAGPWLFSVRGFSTIPATAFAIAAAALLASGLEDRRLTLFSVLITAAFLVRPVLLPSLGLLWLLGACTVRPKRRLVPGMLVGVAMAVVAIAVMVHLEGGWSAFVEPFVKHFGRHTSRLGNNSTEIAELGLVKGVGGLAPAMLYVSAAAIGLLAWWRRAGARSTMAWTLLLGMLGAQLVLLQNRSYPRYAVAAQLAGAPLIAGAAALTPTPVGMAVLLGATGLAAGTSLPLLREQHATRLPAWDAAQGAFEIAAEQGWTVVVEPEVHPFASYLWHLAEARGEATPPLVLSSRAPEPWIGVEGPWVLATVHPHLYMPAEPRRALSFGDVSTALERLTQNRFLEAQLSLNHPLPVGDWWAQEQLPDGTPFMWAGAEAELWLPPLPAGSLVGARVRPARGPDPVLLHMADGEPASLSIPGRSEEVWFWFQTSTTSRTDPRILRFERARGYPPGNGDERPLAVQFLDLVVRPPGTAFGGPVVGTDRVADLELAAAFPEESFATGPGAWLKPAASVHLHPVEAGVIELKLSAPRPTPPAVRVLINGREAVSLAELGPSRRSVELKVTDEDAARDELVITIESDAYVPAKAGHGTDTRHLGVVLHALEYRPATPRRGWWDVELTGMTSEAKEPP